MSDQLDEPDLRIIQLLQIDGRTTVTELAKKAKLSRPTTRKRLKRLLDEELIIVKSGANLRRLGFQVAHVGLEVETERTRREIESRLRNCPRVLDIFRTPDKANIHLSVWGEDYQTLNSTIESFRDMENVSIVYAYYLGTPIHGRIAVDIDSGKNSETPCGRKCGECHSFQNQWCRGCPTSPTHRTSI